MKKTKILVSMAVAALAILGTYTTAFADVGAYAIKDIKTNSIRQYDLKNLTESFLNNKIGQGNDLLFKEFKEDQGKNGVHAIYDDSKKYINYAEAVKAFEEGKVSGKEFQLNGFLKEAKAGETPNYVYERKVSGEKIVNGLNITKEGFELDLSKEVLEAYEDVKIVAAKIVISNGTITGKLLVDAGKDAEVTVKNVKTDAITGLSGSLKLEAVEAKELIIEKALNLNVDAASKLTKLSITAPKGTEVVLSGNLGSVEVSSAVKLTITAGSNVDVKIANDEAKDITVVAEAGATVTTDKPITNTGGSGTVTQPGGTTGGGGGGGTTKTAPVLKNQGIITVDESKKEVKLNNASLSNFTIEVDQAATMKLISGTTELGSWNLEEGINDITTEDNLSALDVTKLFNIFRDTEMSGSDLAEVVDFTAILNTVTSLDNEKKEEIYAELANVISNAGNKQAIYDALNVPSLYNKVQNKENFKKALKPAVDYYNAQTGKNYDVNSLNFINDLEVIMKDVNKNSSIIDGFYKAVNLTLLLSDSNKVAIFDEINMTNVFDAIKSDTATYLGLAILVVENAETFEDSIRSAVNLGRLVEIILEDEEIDVKIVLNNVNGTNTYTVVK